MADTARRFGVADDTRVAGNSGAIFHPQDVGVGAVLAVGQYRMVGANPIVATKDHKSADARVAASTFSFAIGLSGHALPHCVNITTVNLIALGNI